MKIEQNKKTLLWRTENSDYIYKTEQAAIDQARKELAIKLKEVFKDGGKIPVHK